MVAQEERVGGSRCWAELYLLPGIGTASLVAHDVRGDVEEEIKAGRDGLVVAEMGARDADCGFGRQRSLLLDELDESIRICGQDGPGGCPRRLVGRDG